MNALNAFVMFESMLCHQRVAHGKVDLECFFTLVLGKVHQSTLDMIPLIAEESLFTYSRIFFCQRFIFA